MLRLQALGRQALHRPAGPRGEGQRLRLAGGQPLVAGKRDHCAVVGAQHRTRVEGAPTLRLHHLVHAHAQPPIGADAARQHQGTHAHLPNRSATLDQQRVDDGFLEGAGDVGAGLFGIISRGQFVAQRIHRVGLEPAEAEVETRPIGHRPRKPIAGRVTLLRQLRQRRSTRIGQAEDFCGLVEGLAGGVVQRLTEQLVRTDAGHLY